MSSDMKLSTWEMSPEQNRIIESRTYQSTGTCLSTVSSIGCQMHQEYNYFFKTDIVFCNVSDFPFEKYSLSWPILHMRTSVHMINFRVYCFVMTILIIQCLFNEISGLSDNEFLLTNLFIKTNVSCSSFKRCEV